MFVQPAASSTVICTLANESSLGLYYTTPYHIQTSKSVMFIALAPLVHSPVFSACPGDPPNFYRGFLPIRNAVACSNSDDCDRSKSGHVKTEQAW